MKMCPRRLRLKWFIQGLPTLLLGVVLIFPQLTLATNYYVSTTGNDANPGSLAQPWRTIQKAANTMEAGDTVTVQAGTYDERITTQRGGSPGSYITYQASGKAIMQGFVVAHPYIRIEGFDITGPVSEYDAYIELFNSSYCLVLNNTLHDGATNVYGILFDYHHKTSNCTIRGNTLDNINYVNVAVYGDHNVIEGNDFKNSWGDAIYMFGHDNVVRGDHFKNFHADGPLHTDIIQTFGNNGDVAYNIVFENNLVEDCNAQMGNLSQDGVADIRDWDIRNNVFVNIAYQFNIGIPGVRFYNNTFYNVDYVNNIALGFSAGAGGRADRARVMNNIFVGNGLDARNSLYAHDTLSDFQADYNYITDPPPTWNKKTNWSDTVEPHGINGGDPMFVNFAARDFRLLPGSPAIDKGTTVAGFNYDKDGVFRPQGSGWDIGVYEYVGSIDTTPPPAPKNLRIR